jgi:signal transduction histidine kinase
VVTADFPSPDFFVQDSTAGIYVEGSHSPLFVHHLGDLVEVEGVTGPGKFAPVVREQGIRILGRSRLPNPRLFSFSELADGQMDSQWVQVRGIVRSAAIDRTSWRETALAMRVTSGSGEYAVRVPIEQEQDFSQWVNREVLIDGVCGSLFNTRRQLSGVLIYVPRLNFIRMEPLEGETPISALLQFSPGQGAAHRVQVRGVVGYQQSGNALFLQAEGRGLRVLTRQETPLEIGDLVEASGFPGMGESAPVLSDAIFRLIRHGVAPNPLNLNLDLPWEQYDGALVTTEAVLIDRQQQNGGQRLLLRTGDYLFEASAPASPPGNRIQSAPLNSQVRVTGICLVRSGGLWSVPQSLRLLLRSPEDLVVLWAPSWWNSRHAMWLLGIATGTLLMVLAWVAVLGKRLREQMAIVRQKLQSGAVLEERNRIARELHDTLEQELAGITMQLDLASDCFVQLPRVAHEAIENARRMSRHSMLEARRSVWDLRCHLLESGDLISALREIVKPLTSDRIAITVELSGNPVRVPSSVEMNLLRIGQEAVANAIKHSNCRHITIELQYSAKVVCLLVRDDGCGFAPVLSAGHFGLLDMQERAQSMRCQLKIRSEPGNGTMVAIEVPTNGLRDSDEEPKADTYSGR